MPIKKSFINKLQLGTRKFLSVWNCFECKMPSKEKSVRDFRYSFFSNPIIEKSDSTIAVFGKADAKSPQN
jgi:hypothetical protein